MTLQPTTEQLIAMMNFLKEYAFVIPDSNLTLPPEVSGEHYRTNRVFRLLRTGMMSYVGENVGTSNQTFLHGIKMTQQWIDRAYILMLERIKQKLRINTKHCQMEHIQELLLRFNGLDFIDVKTQINNNR